MYALNEYVYFHCMLAWILMNKYTRCRKINSAQCWHGSSFVWRIILNSPL